jgi:hypothetical protein
VLLVDSELRARAGTSLADPPREVRWFLANYVLLNGYVFVLFAVQGVALLALSSGGTIPGWSGSPIEQVFWYAVGSVFYTAVFFGIPSLLVALLAWRLVTRLVGHPQLTAYFVATVMAVAAAVLIERTEPLVPAILLAAALGYATIVREPGSA